MDEPLTIFGETITTGDMANLVKFALGRLPALHRFVRFRFRLGLDDVIQDCYVKVLSEGRLKKWETEKLRPSTGISHCVYWTLKNYGSRKAHYEMPMSADQEWVDTFWARLARENSDEPQHTAMDLQNAMASVLKPHERDLLVRRHFGQGAVLRDIAAEMGCSPQNLEQLEKRAFIKLRKALSR